MPSFKQQRQHHRHSAQTCAYVPAGQAHGLAFHQERSSKQERLHP